MTNDSQLDNFLNFDEEDYEEDYSEIESTDGEVNGSNVISFLDDEYDEDYNDGPVLINSSESNSSLSGKQVLQTFERQVISNGEEDDYEDVLIDDVIIASNDFKNNEEASLSIKSERSLYNSGSISKSLIDNYLDDELYEEDEAFYDNTDIVEEIGFDEVEEKLINDSNVEEILEKPSFEFTEKPEFDREAVESFEESKIIQTEKQEARAISREALTGVSRVNKEVKAKTKKKKSSSHDNRNSFPAPIVSIRQVDDFGRQADLVNEVGIVESKVEDSNLEFYDDNGSSIREDNDSESIENTGVYLKKVKEEVIKPKRAIGNGRLSKKELEFFNNLALHKTRDSLSDGFASFVNPPVNIKESHSARVEREARINLALFGDRGVAKRGSNRFTDGDKMVLEFLALFKYATNKQLALLFGVKTQAVDKRMKKLRENGLIKIKDVYGIGSLFYLSEAGMMLSGYDLPRVTDQTITYSMLSHQFAVNHIAANLWSGGLNVLNEPDYPVKNRKDKYGRELFGDSLTSELEIQSSLGKIKSFDKASAYKPLILSTMREQFTEWARAGRKGLSPEFSFGNEFMWALYPPSSANLVYHVPDLVMKRKRNEDGSPNSVAIEVELLKKSPESYERTLEAYRVDKIMYKKVIWVCKTVGPAKIIERIAKSNGMWQEGRLRIVPILTHEGVFKGKNVWEL